MAERMVTVKAVRAFLYKGARVEPGAECEVTVDEGRLLKSSNKAFLIGEVQIRAKEEEPQAEPIINLKRGKRNV